MSFVHCARHERGVLIHRQPTDTIKQNVLRRMFRGKRYYVAVPTIRQWKWRFKLQSLAHLEFRDRREVPLSLALDPNATHKRV